MDESLLICSLAKAATSSDKSQLGAGTSVHDKGHRSVGRRRNISTPFSCKRSRQQLVLLLSPSSDAAAVDKAVLIRLLVLASAFKDWATLHVS